MLNQDQNPFSEKRTLWAVLIIGAFFVLWSQYMSQKYPQAQAVPSSPTATTGQQTQSAAGANTGTPQEVNKESQGPRDASPVVLTQPEKTFVFENEKIRFLVSSRGMGLKELILKDYTEHDGQPIRLGQSDLLGLFSFSTPQFEQLDFEIQQKAEGHFEGVAKKGTSTIRRELKFHPENSSFFSQIQIENGADEFPAGFFVSIPDRIRTPKSSSFLFPSYDYQDFFIAHSGTKEAININHSTENINQEFKSASLISLGSQYFTSALLDRSEISPEVKISSDVAKGTALAIAAYKPVIWASKMNFEQTFYVGSKSIDVLKSLDAKMGDLVDFGYFTFLAKPMLYTMKWFHSMVGNWGLAIIFLTLVVRLIVLPFNLMSFRSMKAMQKIQPLMQEIRTRYKDDPMTMNREVMNLMKVHKANPLGGCLPMLLQIPIFFALWRVTNSSVELYQSPFYAWIHDLSSHDPYFILPLLMGVTMYLQQKLTPTTMDPTQAKIMAFLPLIFTVFMLTLPSGVALYMVVSAVFGIIQQWYILRDTKAPAPAK